MICEHPDTVISFFQISRNRIVLTEFKCLNQFLKLELNFFEHFQSPMHICLSDHGQNQRGSGH